MFLGLPDKARSYGNRKLEKIRILRPPPPQDA